MAEIEGVETAPFFPYASLEALPPDAKRMLEAYEQRMGFLPNALRPASKLSPITTIPISWQK